MSSLFNLNLPKPVTIFQNSRHIYDCVSCDQVRQRMVSSLWHLVFLDMHQKKGRVALKSDVIIRVLNIIDTVAAVVLNAKPKRDMLITNSREKPPDLSVGM